MRSHVLVVVAAAVGCGEPPSGPFQALPLAARFDRGDLDGEVHVARDRFGISHVHATRPSDLGFVQGYVMAHDRLPQLDLLRRYATGTLAEIHGESAFAHDVAMRFHRIRGYAEQTWNELQVSSIDGELVGVLARFADGVNAYVADIHAGRWSIDPAIQEAGLYPLFAPVAWTPWTPVDSIAIFRLFELAHSWTVDDELALTELDIRIRRAFPTTPALAADLLALAPIAPQLPATFAPPGTPTRPAVPDALLASARAFFAPQVTAAASDVVPPQALLRPYIGSTAIAVGVDYTREQLQTAKAILAADLHGIVANPSLLYPMHQIMEPLPGDVARDVVGMMLPGVPVAIAGTNGLVGWAPTVGTHDVNDIYVEQLAAGGTASVHAGIEEPLGYFTEEIRIGMYGEITETRMQTYAVVPRHGPVIPGHPSDVALSIRYTGYAATHELVTLWELGRPSTATVGEAREVLRGLRHGPHYAVVDKRGASAFTTYADVPVRTAAAQAWSPAFPGGAAPFFVLDGTRPDHEWAPAPRDRTELPLIENFAGAFAIADADPTGATANGTPLDDPYLGVAYANGLREARIHELLDLLRPVDAADITRIQHDTRSAMGAQLRDTLVTILQSAPELSALSAAEQQQIAIARDVLARWDDLETPVANLAAEPSSAATLLFNTFMVHFIERAIGDELATAGVAGRLADDRAARIAYRLLRDPDVLVQNAATGDPLLCTTTCSRVVLDAMLAAVATLGESVGDWRWGRVHALRMRALFPDEAGTLLLPRLDEGPGFQLPGDMFALDRSDGGWDSATDFTPVLGVIYRMQLVGSAFDEPLVMRLELSSGTVLDIRDPHYRDLLETSYLTRTPFVVPHPIADINRAGESRWEFR